MRGERGTSRETRSELWVNSLISLRRHLLKTRNFYDHVYDLKILDVHVGLSDSF